jgi:hypothetical protein
MAAGLQLLSEGPVLISFVAETNAFRPPECAVPRSILVSLEQFRQYCDHQHNFVILRGVREAQTRRDLAVLQNHSINKKT